MSLSVGEIAAVVGEIAPVLTGAWIQKIYQPTARAIVLASRAPGQTLLLYLSTAPGVARLHVLSRKLPNPDVPLPFCQILRAHIQGARIQAVEQVPNDRIVRLRLTAREGPCSLIAELTGRRPGILLLNQDERVLAMLNSHREKRGQPYAIPSRRSRPHEKDQAEEPLLHDVAHPSADWNRRKGPATMSVQEYVIHAIGIPLKCTRDSYRCRRKIYTMQ